MDIASQIHQTCKTQTGPSAGNRRGTAEEAEVHLSRRRHRFDKTREGPAARLEDIQHGFTTEGVSTQQCHLRHHSRKARSLQQVPRRGSSHSPNDLRNLQIPRGYIRQPHEPFLQILPSRKSAPSFFLHSTNRQGQTLPQSPHHLPQPFARIQPRRFGAKIALACQTRSNAQAKRLHIQYPCEVSLQEWGLGICF